MEIWKDITDFNNYEVSSFGNVRNKKTQRILKPWIAGAGYNYVWLGAKYKTSVHRLVALAFIENPDNKKTVDHIDRNKQNNNVENLRWATYQENMWNINSKNIREHYIKDVIYYTVNYSITLNKNMTKSFRNINDAKEYLELLKKKYPRII